MNMSLQDFEDLVSEALDAIPGDIAKHIENVGVFVEEEPDAAHPEVLGAYDGTPLTRRNYVRILPAEGFSVPDRITIYRNPVLRASGTREEALRLVTQVIDHEVGRYFGLTDEELRKTGH